MKKSVSIEKDLWAKVVAECDRTERSASWVVSRALESMLVARSSRAASGREPVVASPAQSSRGTSPPAPTATKWEVTNAPKRTATGRAAGPVPKAKRK